MKVQSVTNDGKGNLTFILKNSKGKLAGIVHKKEFYGNTIKDISIVDYYETNFDDHDEIYLQYTEKIEVDKGMIRRIMHEKEFIIRSIMYFISNSKIKTYVNGVKVRDIKHSLFN